MTQRMNMSLIMLVALTAGIGVFAFARDPSLPLQGLCATGRLFENVWIELLLGFVIAGFVEVLISPAQITAWLGSEPSIRGILLGWMVGLVIPGGPYLLFPLAASLWTTGVPAGALIALITAKSLVSPVRILTYEAPLLGWQLTIARCLPALLVPPIMGILGQWVFNLFVRKSS